MRLLPFIVLWAALVPGFAGTNQASGLPAFRYQGVILQARDLKYKPHDDIIYPTVVRAEGRLESPLGRYYMYYAPHDAPGGICLAFADAPRGPWREYTNNPVITRDWPPHYKVSHVSGPDALWHRAEGKLFLYFHGENPVTRLATSRDGIHFDYDKAVIDTGMFQEVSEASYGRVFERPVAVQEEKFVMLLMGNNRGTRRTYLAASKDGRAWTSRPQAFLSPPPGTDQMAGAFYLEWQGRHYLVFHANDSTGGLNTGYDLYVAETDQEFKRTWHLGKFLERTVVSAENPAVMSPCFLREDNQLYLYFNLGARLKNQIGLALSE